MRIRYHTGYDIDGKWQCIQEGKLTIRLWPSPESAQIARDAGQTGALPEVAEANAVIEDSMPPTVHPCDQQIYTSKRKFREVTRAHDKIEVGNDYDAFMSLKPQNTREPVSKSLIEAHEMLEAREGKSEGEQREIERRFYGENYKTFETELEIERATGGRNGDCLELKDRLLERYGER
jgi:hypothetical protein